MADESAFDGVCDALSVLLAARRGPGLSYVGRVEWGVTRGSVRRVVPACVDADRSRGVVGVEPRVVVEVDYSEIMLMLGRLRDPVLRGVLP